MRRQDLEMVDTSTSRSTRGGWWRLDQDTARARWMIEIARGFELPDFNTCQDQDQWAGRTGRPSRARILQDTKILGDGLDVLLLASALSSLRLGIIVLRTLLLLSPFLFIYFRCWQ